jgi:hypothetical protein
MKVFFTEVVHQVADNMLAHEFPQNKNFQAGLLQATFPLQILIVISIVTSLLVYNLLLTFRLSIRYVLLNRLKPSPCL